jgi:hypothetical protein
LESNIADIKRKEHLWLKGSEVPRFKDSIIATKSDVQFNIGEVSEVVKADSEFDFLDFPHSGIDGISVFRGYHINLKGAS